MDALAIEWPPLATSAASRPGSRLFYRARDIGELPNSRGNPHELARFFGVKVTNRKPSCDNHVLGGEWQSKPPDRENFRDQIWGKFTVLERNAASAIERVTALVRQLLAKRGNTHAVGRDDDLGEIGLSSLDLVNLMLAVEGEFNLKIPDADMTPANFRTVARIEALLGALQSA